MGNQLGESHRRRLWHGLEGSLDGSLRSRLWDSFWSNFWNGFYDSLDGRVWENLCDALQEDEEGSSDDQ